MNENKEIEKLKQDSLGVQDKAREIDVKDKISLETATEFLTFLKQGRKEVDKAFDPIIAKNHEAHKLAIAAKKTYSSPWIEAEMIVKPQISSYMAMLARKQREAEAAAEKAEEEKRLKEEEQLAAAIEAEDSGDLEKRDEIMEEITPEVTPVEHTPAPKLKGTSIRKIWKWEIVDFDKIPRRYLTVDPSLVTAEVRRNKENTSIPGIKAYTVDSIATRIK